MSLKLGGHRQLKLQNRIMEKLEKNWIKQNQRTYLTEEALKELNAKVYTMTIKEEVLNQ